MCASLDVPRCSSDLLSFLASLSVGVSASCFFFHRFLYFLNSPLTHSFAFPSFFSMPPTLSLACLLVGLASSTGHPVIVTPQLWIFSSVLAPIPTSETIKAARLFSLPQRSALSLCLAVSLPPLPHRLSPSSLSLSLSQALLRFLITPFSSLSRSLFSPPLSVALSLCLFRSLSPPSLFPADLLISFPFPLLCFCVFGLSLQVDDIFPAVVSQLLASGADIHATIEESGDTALHIALKLENRSTALSFIKYGRKSIALSLS